MHCTTHKVNTQCHLCLTGFVNCVALANLNVNSDPYYLLTGPVDYAAPTARGEPLGVCEFFGYLVSVRVCVRVCACARARRVRCVTYQLSRTRCECILCHTAALIAAPTHALLFCARVSYIIAGTRRLLMLAYAESKARSLSFLSVHHRGHQESADAGLC